ncbi:MAG: hypothetical protein KC656_17780 [Myxococcales bacterium]|nr:hypothetical protein [Myxococcales bacterium]
MIALLLAAWAVDGEGERIGEELVRHAMDGRWKAVDDQYVRLIAAHPDEVTGEHHRLAAQAAQASGALMLAAQRLQRVTAADPEHPAAARDLATLEQGTGLVMVAGRTLEAVQMPFAPELREAVTAAVAEVDAHGRFVGLLPIGDYRVDGATLQVVPGFRWQVLAPRRR